MYIKTCSWNPLSFSFRLQAKGLCCFQNNTQDLFTFSLLVGGFNPSQRYWSDWKSCPNRGENKTYVKPPPILPWLFQTWAWYLRWDEDWYGLIDGNIPAPVDMENIHMNPLFTGFHTCQVVVWDFFPSTVSIYVHPGRLTWNLRIHPWKRKIIFQTIIFRFYVNLPGCTFWMPIADLFKAQDMTWNRPIQGLKVFAAEKGNSEIAWFTGNHCEPDPVSVHVWRPVWIIHNNHVEKIWLNKKCNRPCWEGGVTSFYHQLEWGSGLGERLKGWKDERRA